MQYCLVRASNIPKYWYILPPCRQNGKWIFLRNQAVNNIIDLWSLISPPLSSPTRTRRGRRLCSNSWWSRPSGRCLMRVRDSILLTCSLGIRERREWGKWGESGEGKKLSSFDVISRRGERACEMRRVERASESRRLACSLKVRLTLVELWSTGGETLFELRALSRFVTIVELKCQMHPATCGCAVSTYFRCCGY